MCFLRPGCHCSDPASATSWLSNTEPHCLNPTTHLSLLLQVVLLWNEGNRSICAAGLLSRLSEVASERATAVSLTSLPWVSTGIIVMWLWIRLLCRTLMRIMSKERDVVTWGQCRESQRWSPFSELCREEENGREWKQILLAWSQRYVEKGWWERETDWNVHPPMCVMGKGREALGKTRETFT